MLIDLDASDLPPPPHEISFSNLCSGDSDIAGSRNKQGMTLVSKSHPLRGDAETCIQNVYERVFGVRDLVLPNNLIAWLDRDGALSCAAGLRVADDGFFSEIYLDAPIEQVLSVLSGRTVAREAIFEVTTLASRSSDVSPAFMRQIGVMGKKAGFEWLFFTATSRLRRLLIRLGVATLELAPAQARKVARPEQWGSYYAHDPCVCAINDRAVDENGVAYRVKPKHA